MELLEARAQVIDMGKRLLQTGLVARTWGNVSCRLNDSHFVITPSGRAYENLEPEEIVIVNINDGKAWGDKRPSSEKGVHLDGYRLRQDVNFIIHTHQPEASVMSAMAADIEVDASSVFGDTVYCAAYGFPGSETLQKNVAEVIAKGQSRALLMAHHGAICLATSGEDALRIAVSLEMLCSYRVRKAFERHLGRPIAAEDSIYQVLLNDLGAELPQAVRPLFRSERRGDAIIFHQADRGERLSLSLDDAALSEEQQIHQAIYRSRPDIGGIHHSFTPSLLAYSSLNRSLATYLDDFAQINGATMECAPIKQDEIVQGLGSRHGILLERSGALCCGNNLYDAEALAMVGEKNARAWLIAQLFPENPIKAISLAECEEMRRFYLESYAKRF